MSEARRKPRPGRPRGAKLLEDWIEAQPHPARARDELAEFIPGKRQDRRPGFSVLTLFKWIWGDKIPSDASKRRIETFTNRAVRPADWFEPADPPAVDPEQRAAS